MYDTPFKKRETHSLSTFFCDPLSGNIILRRRGPRREELLRFFSSLEDQEEHNFTPRKRRIQEKNCLSSS
jgi:hypothetical protein